MRADDDNARPADAPPAAIRRPRRAALVVLGGLIGLLLVLVLLAAGLAGWAWQSEAGQQRLLRQVPGLTLDGARGRLNGGGFAVQQLQWRSGDLTVVVDGLQWQDAQWRWRPHPGAWLGLTLQQPQAIRVRITQATATPPPPGQPLQLPADLRLPLEVLLRGLKLGPVLLNEQPLLASLTADVHVGAEQGALHRIDQLVLDRAPLSVRGQARIGTTGELPLEAQLDLATPPGNTMAWRASVQAQGPLQRLQLQTTLRTEAGAQLNATAGVAPFASWPLLSLLLDTRDLDLSLLAAGLPQTRLSGRAELADVSAGQPLRLNVALDNAAAGPWDAGRLPLRSVRGNLQSQVEQPDRLAFDGLVLELGGMRPAGRIGGSGRWQGAALQLKAELQAVQAAQLDTRAPAATVDGALDLALNGLALPSAAAASAPATAQGLSGTLQSRLTARLPAPPRQSRRAPTPPLELNSTLQFALPADKSLRLQLQPLELRAGGARANATALLQRDAAGALALKTEGTLARFNLGAWWPAANVGSGSDLNGRWRADLQLPALATPAPDLLATLRGTADLALQDSRLAGVPLGATAALQARAQGLQVDAQLQAAANRLQLNGRSSAQRSGAPTQDWQAELQAPALAALAPLLALVPGTEGLRPSAGTLSAKATLNGRWPVLRSEGQLQVDTLQTPQLRVGRGNARWSFNGTALDAPLALDLDLNDVAQAEQRLDRLVAKLDGSLRNHRLQLDAASPLRPPAWTENVVMRDGTAVAVRAAAAASGASGASPTMVVAAGPAASAPRSAAAAPIGSNLQLQARGSWTPASAGNALGAGTWRGTLAQLRAASRSGSGAPWLAAQNIDATATLDAQGAPTQAALAPGRIAAFGGAIAWQQAQWQAPPRAGALPRIALDARLEPLQLAPLLASLQPQLGWRGDLALAGRFVVRSTEGFQADAVLERTAGDLSAVLDGSVRHLGLSELRVVLAARNGRWQLTQKLAGSNVGVLEGSQTVSAPADAIVPPAQAPLQGNVTLRLPDLAVWAPWLPPGWRLGGQLQAQAALGGQVGAPTYSGQLSGEQLRVRNIFEGINLKDGVVQVTLQGQEATVQRFDFQSENGGSVRVRGRVALDAAPQATLQVAAERFRALDRVDRRVALSGNADVSLQAGKLAVRGGFTVDEGLIDVSAADTPSLGDDVLVVGRLDAAGRPLPVVDGGKPPEPGALASASIDLRVDMGQQLRLRGRGLDTLLRGQLQISTSKAGALLVNGVINTTQGTYTAYGQNLAIDRGVITFSGDVGTPRLDILALRADIDTRVGVVVSGSAVDPRVRLYSEPDLPEFEQLTYLLTGRAPEGLGRDETALLQRAALALLAGERGGGNEGFLQKLGIDQLGVGRTDGGDAVVTIGKQLSQRLSVSYERAIAAAGGTWALMYRVANRVTVRARTGTENTVDVIWRWRWD